MEVRLATLDDAPAIARVHVVAWQAAYRGMMPDSLLDSLSVAERESGWRQRLAAGVAEARPIWVVVEEAVEGLVLTGFCATGPPRDVDLAGDAAAGEIGEIYAINLDPAAWGRGHGRALFEHAVADLGRRGCVAVVLWVVADNARARRFYEAAGMQPDGREQTTQRGGAPLHEVRYRMALRL
jgi:ribosomal protein S18 acetylase RimI-like enzyme